MLDDGLETPDSTTDLSSTGSQSLKLGYQALGVFLRSLLPHIDVVYWPSCTRKARPSTTFSAFDRQSRPKQSKRRDNVAELSRLSSGFSKTGSNCNSESAMLPEPSSNKAPLGNHKLFYQDGHHGRAFRSSARGASLRQFLALAWTRPSVNLTAMSVPSKRSSSRRAECECSAATKAAPFLNLKQFHDKRCSATAIRQGGSQNSRRNHSARILAEENGQDLVCVRYRVRCRGRWDTICHLEDVHVLPREIQRRVSHGLSNMVTGAPSDTSSSYMTRSDSREAAAI